MKIYLYDENTKEYLKEAEAQPSPLEPGKYLYPVHSTTIEPPESEEGYCQCWDGSQWVKTEDHRRKRDQGGAIIDGSGTPYWLDGDTYATNARYMDVPGALPDGALLEKPSKPFDLLREEKMAALEQTFEQACRDAHLLSSVGFEIDADETANRNIEGLMLVMDDTETVMFCDYDNQFREVNKEQLETMRKEIVKHSQGLYQTKWQHRSLIEASTSQEELDAISLVF